MNHPTLGLHPTLRKGMQREADTATQPGLARHSPTQPKMARPGQADGSESLASRLAWALLVKAKDWGWAGPGPVDKSEGLGTRLSQCL